MKRVGAAVTGCNDAIVTRAVEATIWSRLVVIFIAAHCHGGDIHRECARVGARFMVCSIACDGSGHQVACRVATWY